ncbi:MAG: dUTP diphosphatase [Flavobacteriales bacterium]|jgi:dUTP pyrophosphatase
MEVKIENLGACELPSYESESAAGMDVRANIQEPMIIPPQAFKLIPTGLRMEIPKGTECQVRPRSGLAFKHGISVLNSPGTIDSDYRGEIGVLLINHSSKPFTINPCDRIAQLVFTPVFNVVLNLKSPLTSSERGANGFGSTGKN